MRREAVNTVKAPAAVGPYSQAMCSGGLLFVSGQIPLDPATGVMVQGGAAEQTRRVLENLKAVLEAAGGGLQDVLKTTVFMTDLGAFAEMNEVYAGFFAGVEGGPPARAAMEVRALPKGAQVEIEAVARLRGG